MLDKDKAVQGVAVYAEFARENATTQIIISPDGYMSEGSLVPATIIRRTITTHTPKKQWKFSRLSRMDANTSLADEAACDAYVEERMTYAGTLFDQLLRGGWSLVKKPILVEVSRKDLDNIYLSKTPTKMIYRISQSRIALDFPAEILNDAPAGVAAPTS
jgi:hypothetical protein